MKIYILLMLLIVTTLQLNCQWKESDNPIEKKGLGSFYFFFGDIYETTGLSINKYANGNKHTLADSFITNIGSYKILQYGDTLFMSVSDNWYKGNGLFYPKTKTFHKSTDKGFTWTYIADLPSAANNYYIYKDKIYITAGIKILIYDPKTSIWDTLITNHLIDNIAFKNDTLVGIRSVDQGTSYYNDVNFSFDGGKTWEVRNKFLPSQLFIRDVAVLDSVVLIGTQAGIFRSGDMGQRWFPSMKGVDLLTSSSIYEIKQSEGVFYFVAEHGVYYSTDTGLNWILFDKIPKNFQIDLFRVSNDTICYTGNNGYDKESAYSTDGGNTFNKLEKDTNVDINDIIKNENKYYYLTNNYLYSSDEFAKDYKRIDGNSFFENEKKYLNRYLKKSKNNLYVLKTYNSENLLARSTDNGENWNYVSIGDSNQYELIRYAISNDILYVSTNAGVLTSTDYGDNWNFLKTGNDSLDAYIGGSVKYYEDGDIIYLYHDNLLLKIKDKKVINLLSEKSEINKMILQHKIKSLIANGEKLFFTTGGKITYNSTDGGGSFNKVESNIAVNASNIASYDDVYFSASRDAVYYTLDLGKNWQNITSGIKAVDIVSIYSIFAYDNLLILPCLNLYYRSISDLKATSVEVRDNIHTSFFFLNDVYPNPTNNITNISFYTDKTKVTNEDNIDLYNLSGLKINKNNYKVLSINQEDFKTIISIDISGLQNGLYFLGINYGSEIKYCKVIKSK